MNDEKEVFVDKLLIFMKNHIEKIGQPINLVHFNFSSQGKDLTDFKKNIDISDSEFEIIIKYCFTNEYVTRIDAGSDYNDVQLTNKGLVKANSVENSKYSKLKEQISTRPINPPNIKFSNNVPNIKNRTMEMVPVSSSNIESVGHENRTLYIRFHSGGLYSYSGVPESVYTALLNASSKGQFFHRNIKNVYSYRKIG